MKKNTNKAFFFDRDGVLNVDRATYTFRVEDFEIMPYAFQVLCFIRKKGFRLIVITNQAGIAKGLYSMKEVNECHEYLQSETGRLIDDFYVAPEHPDSSESLSRKPGSLLFEKAIAKYCLDAAQCWMIGDREKDLIPATALGMKTILIGNNADIHSDYKIKTLRDLLNIKEIKEY